jgi:hypothetical protein
VGGGGEREEEHQEVESSSREDGGLCLKGPSHNSHKNRICRDLVSTYRKADFGLESINAGSGSWAPGWLLPVSTVPVLI